MKTYIFDIDHTLLRSATGIYFVKEGLTRKFFQRRQLIRIPIVLIKYRMGFLKGNIVEREIPFMKGLTRKDIEEIGRAGFRKYGLSDVYEDAKNLIQNLKNQGSHVIFATSSFDYSVRPVAEYFGIDDVIASSFEFDGDSCTGYIEGRAAFGDSKKTKVMAYLEDRGINKNDCVFYSDSHHDIPLLEYVGKAVAVNPDRKLKSAAIKNGWEILRFR
ncbi:HAD family hydrolase [Spirochaeta isovalerica]|uniref:HAD superfamily hydrolase (TIGR01490 family) n=1 Tax=Spirochaeta isovalerica TaxID=150 RepID=A0A841R3X6_9SPIO|nr:HAD superfamily hydrolase (TIGR01490 family) [Spirochaeta isovalerica]